MIFVNKLVRASNYEEFPWITNKVMEVITQNKYENSWEISAALNEGKTTLKNTLHNMDSMTRDIMREDVIQAAAGAHIDNDDLASLIEELAKTGDYSEEGIEIQRAAIETHKALRTSAEDQIERLKELVQDHKGLQTEALEYGEKHRVADEQDNEKPAAPAFKPDEFNM